MKNKKKIETRREKEYGKISSISKKNIALIVAGVFLLVVALFAFGYKGILLRESANSGMTGFSVSDTSMYDFGGMFGYGLHKSSYFNNPATGGQSCPSGYISQQIIVSSAFDVNLSYCYRVHQSGRASFYNFGGIYASSTDTRSSNIIFNNPATGGQSCPSGYTTFSPLLLHDPNMLSSNISFCYNSLTSTNSLYDFGGMFTFKDYNERPIGTLSSLFESVNNPATNGQSCPSGYTRFKFFDVPVYDNMYIPSYICYKNYGAVACTQTTCAAQGKNCGSISDGCGGTLNCGSCLTGTCGGGGVANVCEQIEKIRFSFQETVYSGIDGEVKDYTGKNNGTTFGGVSVDSTGIDGKSARLDGDDDYIQVPDSISSRITGNYSISGWVKFNRFFEADKYPNIMGKMSASEGGINLGYLTWGYGSKGRIYAGHLKSDGLWGCINYFEPFQDWNLGVWHFYASTYDGRSLKSYFDGTLIVENSCTILHLSRAPWIIGKHSYDNQYGFLPANIDELIIFNKTLSSQDILNIYNNQKARLITPGSCTPTTCTTQGKNCGSIPDLCGGTLSCGTCLTGTCGGGGVANVCGQAAACIPTTCAAQGKNCGTILNGTCSGTLNCGTCTSPQTCGGSGTANICGVSGGSGGGGTTCTAESDSVFCSRQGKNCGQVSARDNCGVTRTVSSCGTCTSPQTCGGGGISNACGSFGAVSSLSKNDLFVKLDAIQLLTPQPNSFSVLYGGKKVQGIRLNSISSDARQMILTKIFGTGNPSVGSYTSSLINGFNHYALLENGQDGLELIVYSVGGKVTQYPSSFAVPFLKRGISLSPRNDGECMNGIKEGNEQCEIKSLTILDNNADCSQETSVCLGNKIARRDAFGSCGINCKCTVDKFDSPKCERGICGAQCAVNSDCTEVYGSGWTCDGSCSCVKANQDYCGDGTVNRNIGEYCEKDGDCSAENEKCVGCLCVLKSYCGDGTVQRSNDEGVYEQCDPLSKNNFIVCGTSNIGQCRVGVSSCNDECMYKTQCTGQILPDLTETCDDGIDNNCNGLVDENCVCTNGQKQDCGSDFGMCKKGKQTCSGSKWGTCEGEIRPSSEICDGIDNNCNGIVDEGVRNILGRCGVVSQPEICDGIDNNANGLIDEAGVCEVVRTKLCTDNDPANDALVKGMVILKSKEYPDTCEESGKSIRQYYCFGNKLETFVERCPSGSTCKSGICKASSSTPSTSTGQGNPAPAQSQELCNDDNIKTSLSVKGSINYNGATYEDKCEESGKSVRKYSCRDDKIFSFVQRCPTGKSCSEGSCV